MNFTSRPFIILELLLLLPFFAVLIYFDYLPNNDEIFQVEAAIRLSKNLGYTCSWGIPSELSDLDFKYLTAWPPGYSFLISSILFCGFNIFTSLKLLKCIFILNAIFQWNRFAEIKLLNQNARLVFCFIITVFATTISASPTELILLTLIGYILNLAESLQNKIQTKLSLFHFGLAISSGILIKYSWMGFNFGFLIWGIINLQKRSFNNLSLLLLPTILVSTLLFTSNYLNANQLNTIATLDTLHLKDAFYKLFSFPILKVLQSAFLFSSQLPILFQKVFLYFGFDITFLLSIAFWFLFFKSIIERYKISSIKNVIFNIQTIIFLSSLVFFFSISILFYTNMSEWIPSIESRYYYPISPLILLFLVSSRSSNIPINSNFRKQLVLLYFALFLVQGIYTYSKYRLFSIVDEERGKVSSFLKTNALESNLVVYTDGNWKNKFIRNGINNVFVASSPAVLDIKYAPSTIVVFVFSNIDYSSFKYPKALIDNKLIASLKMKCFREVTLSNNTFVYIKKY